MNVERDVIHTQIWEEVPEPDNPFAAAACFCSGYDVYGDLLENASWIEYLFLLFRQERPVPWQTKLLERLAVVAANFGPRDHSVRAAMSAGAGGSNHAACLMAALAVGAGQLNGAREVGLAMDCWQDCGQELDAWQDRLKHPTRAARADTWPSLEHPAGFDPNGATCPTPVRQTLDFLAAQRAAGAVDWLRQHRLELEAAAGCPLAMTGVAAAVLTDLGFSASQGEMLYLLLRLPGAAAHALEQLNSGWRRYPFFAKGLELADDPGRECAEEVRSFDGGVNERT
jgi:citrate synthase